MAFAAMGKQLGLGLLCGALVAGGAEDETPRVVLPPMEVTAPVVRPDGKPWRYAQVSGWEVFSEVSDSRARALLVGLHKFDFALRVIQPRLVAGPDAPLTILFVNAAAYQEIVGPAATDTTAGFSALVRRGRQSAIVINTEAEFEVLNASEGDEDGNTIDAFRQLNRQYLHHVLSAQDAPLPTWLEEGLAQALTDVEYREAWLTYGKVDTEQNMPGGEQDAPMAIDDFLAASPALSGLSFKQVFAHRNFMPLAEFFEAKRADGTAPSSDSAWAKQAYAFVHFCLFGNKLRYQESLAKLATRLQTEPMSEPLFQECFGIGYAKMEKELRGYILHTRMKYQRYDLKPEQRLKPVAIVFRDASPAEVARLTETIRGGAAVSK
jgi:hypothetical protein